MESEAGLVKTPIGSRVLVGARAIGRAVLDGLFPPVCLVCARAVGTPDGLCPACWWQLVPITAPLCLILGLPFETDMGSGAVSPKAIADPPAFDRSRSAVTYNEVARAIIAKLKYGDRPELALFCARMMMGVGHELWDRDTVLVPVPLHRQRRFSRRYNQSGELARALAKLSGLPLDTGMVERHRPTRQQVGLTARQRARNVEGAFRLRQGAERRLAGRRLVLVDDVLTTGATVNAVARMLRRRGAGHIDVITFARVVFDPDMPI